MIKPKWRAAIFVIITIIVIAAMDSYDRAMIRMHPYPQPNFLGSTWYGPVLLLLIPVSFGWFAMGARSRGAKVAGLIGTALLLFFWVILVYNGMSVVGSVPWGLPPLGGPVR